MNMQCTTTVLLSWRNNLAAVRCQNAHDGFINVMKDLIHNAARNHADAIAALSNGGCILRYPARKEATFYPIHECLWYGQSFFEWCREVVDGVEDLCAVDQ